MIIAIITEMESLKWIGLTFLFLMVGITEQNYTITPINSSSGLYYEHIGESYLSNNNWEFVTYIDFKDYLIFYQYIHQQVEKLREFCIEFNSKMLDSSECENKLEQVENNMQVVTETHKTMCDYLGITFTSRKKRFWQAAAAFAAPYILEPLGQEIARSIFGNNDLEKFKYYDQQIADLYQSQNDIINELNHQITFFKIDTETRGQQIHYLKRTQDKINFQLNIVNQTSFQDSIEKNKKINDLNNLLKITQSQLKKQEQINKYQSKDISNIKHTLERFDRNFEKVKNDVSSNSQRINASEIRYRLNSVTLDFLIIWSIFQVKQEQLFNAIVHSNNGHLDPYIITPVKLLDLLYSAIPNLPTGTKFPIIPNFENAMELYNILEPNIYFYNYSIVFRLNIKLVDINTYNIYRIHSMPVHTEVNKFVFIIPDKPYLLIDNYNRQYTLFSEEKMEKCNRLNSLFICTDTSTYITSYNLECEVLLFVNEEISNKCNIREIVPLKPFVLQLTKRTRWIYVVPRTTILLLNCYNDRRSINIINSGILDTGTCTAWLNGTLLKHSMVLYASVDTSKDYSPNAQVTNIIKGSEIESRFKELEPVELQKIILPYYFDEMKKELETNSIYVRTSSDPVNYFQLEKKKKHDKRKNDINIVVVVAVAIVTIVLIGLIVFVNKIFHCNVQNDKRNMLNS